MIDSIVRAVLKRVRGKDISIAPGLSPLAVLANAVEKGLGPLLRGWLTKPFLGDSKGHFFLGRGCKLLTKRQLRVGANVYIGSYSYIDCLSLDGVTIGDNVTIREGCWLQLTSSFDKPGSKITIGNQVYIGPRAILGAAAPLSIGDRCQFGANVSLIAENHQFSGDADIFEQGVTRKGITIGRDVWIGNNVTILDGVDIGDGAVIGAGSVVTKSVPSKSVAVGVPARVIKTR
jgi:acetyltransferase-like isoleucine patch superfamily enzyme